MANKESPKKHSQSEVNSKIELTKELLKNTEEGLQILKNEMSEFIESKKKELLQDINSKSNEPGSDHSIEIETKIKDTPQYKNFILEYEYLVSNSKQLKDYLNKNKTNEPEVQNQASRDNFDESSGSDISR